MSRKNSCCDSENDQGQNSPFEMLTNENERDESCCGVSILKNPKSPDPATVPWRDGSVTTAIGETYRASTRLTWRDHFGGFKARWGINRMGYTVRPGLYAIGTPEAESEVFVSANYKISFDLLRSKLAGVNGWILVLDTKGINVWCAAGKGTFGTAELIKQIRETRLSEVVSRHRLIVPQLGAPGVAGHKVKEETGFKVKFGPVRAADLPKFLETGRVATVEMRRVRFPLWERIVLVPVELVTSLKYFSIIVLIFFLLGGFVSGSYSIANLLTAGLWSVVFLAAGFLAGVLLTPALLPWLPGRSFSAKGGWAGLIALIGLASFFLMSSSLPDSSWAIAGWCFLIPALASFLGMNFTGSSTFTSFSGVKKEMHYAVRVQVGMVLTGLGLWLTGRFV